MTGRFAFEGTAMTHCAMWEVTYLPYKPSTNPNLNLNLNPIPNLKPET